VKILVTGCNGFIGREFVSYFKNSNYKIYSTNRNNLNILNKKEVDNFFLNNEIDIVVHTAVRGGRRNHKESYKDFLCNMTMYDNLSNNANNFKLMFHFGSGAEFDRRKDIDNVKEEEIYDSFPVDFYGLSKNVISKKIRKHNDNIVNLRLFGCFGFLEDSSRMIRNSMNRALSNKSIVVHQDRKMDFFYIKDLFKVIEFYINNIDSDLPNDVNMVYDEKKNLYQLANMIKLLTKNKIDVIIKNERTGNSYTGNGEILSKLNIDFIGLEKGIKEVYNKCLS
jgi:nucleoside-diphosphate-sugar epimerase